VETAAFDYVLPEDRIAQEPLAQRDAARLLVDRGPDRTPDHRHVTDLPDLLEPGDLLVVNTTKVLPARLHLQRPTGGAAEVLLLEPRTPLDLSVSTSATEQPVGDGSGGGDGPRRTTWEALVRPSRKMPAGTPLVPPDQGDDLQVTVEDDLGEGRRVVHLDVRGDLQQVLGRRGEMPLPPYIATSLEEPDRYQTVYADRPGSAAAPTAGLHLTPSLLARCAERGIERADVELVVGLGTFRPIAVDDVHAHVMHAERYHVPTSTMEACRRTRAAGGRVVAVGTTSVRALESAAASGELTGRTELYIHRPYEWRVVDRLLTNFHLPRSSLLVMVDAFVGPRWRDLYADALAEGYRFLSFGDAMLISRQR
jgi:S-adenosylmethionine:tRNA ribosyltransferase-isomerase